MSAIKWTATILAAGFIAQFGKKFADHLINRYRTRVDGVNRSKGIQDNKGSKDLPGKEAVAALQEVKLAKKRMKMEKKSLKKGRSY